jgi:hypothetical protein
VGTADSDQKPVVLSTVSSKYGKAIVDAAPKANQPESKSVKRVATDGPITSHPDPTRFDDWEHAGRCIDF